jgi:succinate dehydrogenase / fumarate reductase cytochrome b subunit
MGVSGFVWVGFVLVHMAGNLLILVGPDAYNAYGHAITGNKPLLFVAEAILILALLVHAVTGLWLAKENRKSRPVRYALTPNGSKGASIASKTMAIQGSIILAFIITHLATFKFGEYFETTVHGVAMRDLHRLVVQVFHQPLYVAWYVVCLILVGFHLSHGFGSIFQSLGLKNDAWAPKIKVLSVSYAAIVAAGFLVQPLYVFFLAN